MLCKFIEENDLEFKWYRELRVGSMTVYPIGYVITYTHKYSLNSKRGILLNLCYSERLKSELMELRYV